MQTIAYRPYTPDERLRVSVAHRNLFDGVGVPGMQPDTMVPVGILHSGVQLLERLEHFTAQLPLAEQKGEMNGQVASWTILEHPGWLCLR